MIFDKRSCTTEDTSFGGETVRYRAWRGLPYVERPVVPEYQTINIYAPEEYFEGKSIDGYTAETAPVFMPNDVARLCGGGSGHSGQEPGRRSGPGVHRGLQGRGPLAAAFRQGFAGG